MKISLSSISTKDLATLAERTIGTSKKNGYGQVQDHQLLKEVEQEYAAYQQVYAKLTFSGKGADVAEADRNRDKLFSAMKGYLAGFQGLPDLESHADAAALYQTFKTFGLDLDRLSYSAETAQMNKLLEELAKPDNRNRLVRLKIAAYADRLKQAQADFEALYSEQAGANADLRDLPSATTIRRNLETALKNYFALLTAMKAVKGWEKLYAEINELAKAAKNSNQRKDAPGAPAGGE